MPTNDRVPEQLKDAGEYDVERRSEVGLAMPVPSGKS